MSGDAHDLTRRWGCDALARTLIRSGYTDAEVLESLRADETERKMLPTPERLLRARISALRAGEAPEGKAPHPGPSPIVTREQVLAKQAELRSAGRHSGIGSLAKALNVHESTIRRRLSGD